MSYLGFSHGVAPATPASGSSNEYVDSADNRRHKQIDGTTGRTNVLTPRGLDGYNYLINGGFGVAQRQVLTTLTTYSNTTTRGFAFDRWSMVNQNASVQAAAIDTIAAVETGLTNRFYGRFVKITNSGKIIVSQIIEAAACAHLRGRTVTLQCKMRQSTGSGLSVKMGLQYLSTAGTVDTLAGTYASAYGAAGTDPTFTANTALVTPTTVFSPTGTISSTAGGALCTLTSAWQMFSATFVVPTGMMNLIPVFFTDSLMAATDALCIGEAGLYEGQETMDWYPPHVDAELRQCQRYYQKSFQPLVAPAQNPGVNTGEFMWVSSFATAVPSRSPRHQYVVPMRANPTQVFFNPAAANALIRDETGAADSTVNAVLGNLQTGFSLTYTSAAGTAVGNAIGVHWTSDAEI